MKELWEDKKLEIIVGTGNSEELKNSAHICGHISAHIRSHFNAHIPSHIRIHIRSHIEDILQSDPITII